MSSSNPFSQQSIDASDDEETETAKVEEKVEDLSLLLSSSLNKKPITLMRPSVRRGTSPARWP